MSHRESAVVKRYLSEEEELLAGEVEEWLKKNKPADFHLAEDRFLHLKKLGSAVFDYPSIRDTQFLNGVIRDEGHLAEALLAFSSPSHLLHIPTKVVALRSFLVAKFHVFSLLLYMAGDNPEYHTPLRNVVISVICTLIAEEVYFSCLADTAFSRNTKASLANDLIAL